MSQIMEAWEDVLREAISRDFDVAEMAIFQIGLVLQRHSGPNVDAPEIYETNLPRALQRLVLDESRQRDTVIYLAALLPNYLPHAPSILYALAQAQPHLLAERLPEQLAELGAKLAPAAAYEALRVLERCASVEDAEVQARLRAPALLGLVVRWAESKDADLAARAARWLARIEGEGG